MENIETEAERKTSDTRVYRCDVYSHFRAVARMSGSEREGGGLPVPKSLTQQATQTGTRHASVYTGKYQQSHTQTHTYTYTHMHTHTHAHTLSHYLCTHTYIKYTKVQGEHALNPSANQRSSKELYASKMSDKELHAPCSAGN